MENALSKVKDEKGMKRVEKFLKEDICPDCGGTRLSVAAREPKLRGISLDEACRLSLSELVKWVAGVPESLPEEMRPMANSICESFQTVAKRRWIWASAISAWIGAALYALHRRAAANAARPGGAQPYNRRSICAG